MDRIAIVGCGGSGKSHLARELGARLGIPPAHLDALYYDRDWKPLDQDTFAARQRDLVAAADVVVLRRRRAVRHYLGSLTLRASWDPGGSWGD